MFLKISLIDKWRRKFFCGEESFFVDKNEERVEHKGKKCNTPMFLTTSNLDATDGPTYLCGPKLIAAEGSKLVGGGKAADAASHLQGEITNQLQHMPAATVFEALHQTLKHINTATALLLPSKSHVKCLLWPM